ncbi:MAG: hypothetical protein H6822_21390 [Planctomycetaceae bacterium]|nr:hypothetical protein [Planctomycetales bacterium]MCB9924749.1 hypothetical protein [Planctomycetaceae bacterium]
MPEVENTSAEVEHQYHHYTGNRIPWYVRLMWLAFWIFAVVYTIRYLFPAIQVELFERL